MVPGKNARIEQVERRRAHPPAAVFFDQPRVGIFLLRVFVEVLHVSVRGSRIEVEIVFLYVLAVIPFVTCQTEEPFFENGVFSVPEGNSETDMLMAVDRKSTRLNSSH